jgi:hypothetical protein
MGQPNANRLQYEYITALTSSANDDRQTLANTGFLKVGDVLEFWDQAPSGNLLTLVGTRSITGVVPNLEITLDSAIDLTVVTGTAVIRNRSIDDVAAILDRIGLLYAQSEDYKINWAAPISASELATPIGGQSRQAVSNSSYFEAGDTWALIHDGGLAGTGSVISTDDALNKVVIDSSIDAGALTNPYLINTSVSLKQELERLRSSSETLRVQEALADGDRQNTAFLVSQKFVVHSTDLYLDGVKKRKGTAGTRAALSNGAANAQLLLTALVLGTDGNDLDFEMVDPAAPSSALAVTVTGTYNAGDRKVRVSLATDGASVITSTAAQVAAAVNAHATAKRLLLVRYGGTGAGVQAALAPTPLAGGLNDGTGDYAELEQVDVNVITGSGYRWVSFHVRPNEANRLNSPPRDSEELDIVYSVAT